MGIDWFFTDRSSRFVRPGQSRAACHQVHGTGVAVVGPDFPYDDPPQADALVTRLTGVALVIHVADCVPVLLADQRAGVIGAAHAGRVGLLAGVLQATVAAMRDLGASDVHAWIGPHICASCYEVPADMAAAAWELIPATLAVSRLGTPAIDLGAGALAVLDSEGVGRTERHDPCTMCDARFFSYRRDRTLQRQEGIIVRTARVGPNEPGRAVA